MTNAGVMAFQLYDLVNGAKGDITYEEAREELGLTAEEMAEAFGILKEAMDLRRAHRRRSGSSLSVGTNLTELGDSLHRVLTSA